MAKKARIRIDLKAVQNGPVLIRDAKGRYSIYHKGKSKSGVPMARRVILHTNVEERANAKFDDWKQKNGYAENGNAGTDLVIHPTADPDAEAEEARKAKGRAYYHARKARESAEANAPLPVRQMKPRNSGAPDPVMLQAVMQQLSSTLQSMAACVKMLTVVLGNNPQD